MENLFAQLGYTVSNNKESADFDKMELLYINNPDGTIRWFWPSKVNKPIFLKFYNVSGLKSFLFSLAVKMVFIFKLQSIVFKRKTIYFEKTENNVPGFYMNDNWAVFTGTVGPNNKSIIYSENDGISSFMKVACSETAKALIKREELILNRLYMSNLETFQVPEVLESGDSFIQITDISKSGKRNVEITDMHLNALIEMNEISSMKMPLKEIDKWSKIKADVSILSQTKDLRMPKGLIKKINLLVDQIKDDEEIEVSLSHGDFTPWNMFSTNNQLFVYDWELADFFKPLGFDLFHFIIQQGILVERKSWLEIKNNLNSQINCQKFGQLSKFKNIDIEKYLKYYLIFNTVYYLDLYSKQSSWHKQVYWFINIWNEAFSSILKLDYSERELVIMDTFDYLLPKNYGAVKFPNMMPEKLSVNSDIDLLIDISNRKDLCEFFNEHPLVLNYKILNKSFMSSLQLFMNDGNILNIDLIYKFKRKHLELLSTEELLKNTYTNNFGVKMLDVMDNARYIGMFYSLNGQSIPSKYQYYEEILCHSSSKLDSQIYPCYLYEKCDNRNLFKFLKSSPSNSFLKGFVNKVDYVIDSVKTVLFNQGTVITFSGVDGAGKSTVIENLKLRVEKQLRKRVVVLRHRPSFLPILSSFAKGKKQAEQDAANNLPRQGTNKNFISSLFRFCYYYVDYLFGQFMIYIKYVSKGYVVIYDRYYFDFISDSKRSNIKLPKFLLKFGYKFIMKPKFNFFLYANADVILSRKKELDKESIEILTSDYLAQFKEFEIHSNKSRYISINNENLQTTIDTVFDNIVFHAA